MTRCIDVEPPTINCPVNRTVRSAEKLPYASVEWPVPVTRDNSGFFPLLTSVPALHFPMKFKIGMTAIRYIAEDLSGNKASCMFYVRVLDTQPPVIDYCESP